MVLIINLKTTKNGVKINACLKNVNPTLILVLLYFIQTVRVNRRPGIIQVATDFELKIKNIQISFKVIGTNQNGQCLFNLKYKNRRRCIARNTYQAFPFDTISSRLELHLLLYITIVYFGRWQTVLIHFLTARITACRRHVS